jgi:hypothetical protein
MPASLPPAHSGQWGLLAPLAVSAPGLDPVRLPAVHAHAGSPTRMISHSSVIPRFFKTLFRTNPRPRPSRSAARRAAGVDQEVGVLPTSARRPAAPRMPASSISFQAFSSWCRRPPGRAEPRRVAEGRARVRSRVGWVASRGRAARPCARPAPPGRRAGPRQNVASVITQPSGRSRLAVARRRSAGGSVTIARRGSRRASTSTVGDIACRSSRRSCAPRRRWCRGWCAGRSGRCPPRPPCAPHAHPAPRPRRHPVALDLDRR